MMHVHAVHVILVVSTAVQDASDLPHHAHSQEHCVRPAWGTPHSTIEDHSVHVASALVKQRNTRASTSYDLSRHSMVRGAVKAQEASASQVRCTCSMQGLNEQKTPSGRRHASADPATCDTTACTSASQHSQMRSSSLETLAHGPHQDRGFVGAGCLALASEHGLAGVWDGGQLRRRGLQCAVDLPGARQVQEEGIRLAMELLREAVLLYIVLPYCHQAPQAMAAHEHVPLRF